MKRLFMFVLVAFGLLITTLASADRMTASQKEFVDFMIPKIEKANQQILQQRQKLVALYKKYQNQGEISLETNKLWLQKLAKEYGLKDANLKSRYTWEQLLSRVDIVPTPLVLAQTINESAWGRSRFAKEGNSYFGQWCSAPGCGIKPRLASPDSPWQVRSFSNAYDSIVSYLNNINSNRAYRGLRELRFELREAGKPLNGHTLAEGLKDYSEKGVQYIAIMQNIISNFQLAQAVQNYNQEATA